MSDGSKIEWCDASWNPIVGCSVLTRGCKRCYAMKLAHRFVTQKNSPYFGLTRMTKGGAVWTGELRLVESALLKPLAWKRPRVVFVNSMGDLFHEEAPSEWIELVLCVAALASQHTFLVLTKRAERMATFLGTEGRRRKIAARAMCVSNMLAADGGHKARIKLDHFSEAFRGSGPLRNVWFGVSVEDQERANERIPFLLETPAAKRFLSCEPLLGPIDTIGRLDPGRCGCEVCATTTQRCTASRHPIDWVIVGGESGPGARPMHPSWARDLRDQCTRAGVPYFFKQWGEWGVCKGDDALGSPSYVVNGEIIGRMGKHCAGRLLDGIEWNERPPLAHEEPRLAA